MQGHRGQGMDTFDVQAASINKNLSGKNNKKFNLNRTTDSDYQGYRGEGYETTDGNPNGDNDPNSIHRQRMAQGYTDNDEP
jgi:hypothetical protein